MNGYAEYAPMSQSIVRVQAEDPARAVERGPHPVALLVPVEGRGQVLLPVLGPAHRAAQPQRGCRDGDLLPADHALQPETAAHVRGDHPDRPLGDAQRLGDPGPYLVRHLGGDVQHQLPVPVVPLGQAGPALQRHGRHPGAGELPADHHGRAREDPAEPFVVEHQQVHQAVAAGLRVHLRGAVRQRGGEARHGRARIPVHLDQFRAVLGQVGVSGDDHRDRFPGEADRLAGQ